MNENESPVIHYRLGIPTKKHVAYVAWDTGVALWCTLYWVHVLKMGWEWFIAPVYGVPAPPFHVVMLIALVVHMTVPTGLEYGAQKTVTLIDAPYAQPGAFRRIAVAGLRNTFWLSLFWLAMWLVHLIA